MRDTFRPPLLFFTCFFRRRYSRSSSFRRVFRFLSAYCQPFHSTPVFVCHQSLPSVFRWIPTLGVVLHCFASLLSFSSSIYYAILLFNIISSVSSYVLQVSITAVGSHHRAHQKCRFLVISACVSHVMSLRGLFCLIPISFTSATARHVMLFDKNIVVVDFSAMFVRASPA